MRRFIIRLLISFAGIAAIALIVTVGLGLMQHVILTGSTE